MTLHRQRSDHEDVADLIEKVLAILPTAIPEHGCGVLTVWVSPGPVSEDDRVRLHQHLIDAHGALGVLSMGVRTQRADAASR